MARGINKVILASDSVDATDEQADAFWSKVDIKDNIKECWEWLGARKPKGYGNVRINKKYLLSHRVAFELANGLIPKKYIVCHTCDNPSCCNPSHLMLGTVKSNAADMLIKNRQKKRSINSRGSQNCNAKVDESDVIEIRRAYKDKVLNQYQLSDKYGISQTAIGCIVRNKTWSHVNV